MKRRKFYLINLFDFHFFYIHNHPLKKKVKLKVKFAYVIKLVHRVIKKLPIIVKP